MMASPLTSIPQNILEDNAKKIEFKNLIKEKILKPSKLATYSSIRNHHSHLVIRDSHYLIKSPTSFVTCASCHRGRVLKITSIRDSTTDELLRVIYSTISKNPCSKRKQTPKDLTIPRTLVHNYEDHISEDFNLVNKKQKLHTLPNILGLNNNALINPNNHDFNNDRLIGLTSTSVLKPQIPKVQDFLADFEEPLELPTINEKLNVSSLGTTIKVTGYTLTSLYQGNSNFPATLDLFTSIGIESDICNNYFTKDTLIIPLPAYSATLYMKEFNNDLFLKDVMLVETINERIDRFLDQQDLDLNNFKVVFLFNFFQEGIPDRPHENQAHKYVGNVYVIHGFNVLDDSSLTFNTSRYTYNHNYTWVDSKEEWLKIEIFNELVIKKLQTSIFTKFQQDLLGTHVNSSVLERGSIMNLIPYTVDDSYIVTSTASLYVVSFITLKVLRVLTGEDGLQMIAYLLSIKVNTRHNLHLLKLLLDKLAQQNQFLS